MEPMPPPTPMGEPPREGLPIPGLDAPLAMEAAQAFSPGRALGNGISALRRAPGPMLVAGLLMMIFDGGGSGGGGGNGGGGNYDPPEQHANDSSGQYDDPYSDLLDSVGTPVHSAVTNAFGDVFEPAEIYLQIGGPEVAALIVIGLVVIVCMFILITVFWLISSYLRPGVIRLHSHILQTADPQNFKIIFSGSDRWKDMLLFSLLSGCISFGTTLLTLLPGGVLIALGAANETPWMVMVGGLLVLFITLPAVFYVALGLSMGAHAVTLENRSATEALKRSWGLARGIRLRILLYQFVTGLAFLGAILVGLLFCCVGVLITAPAGRAVYDFGFTESFLLLTRGESVTGYWELWRLKQAGQIP